MHGIERFKGRSHKTRMELLIRKIEKMDLSSAAYDNYFHAAIRILIDHFNMGHEVVILETSLDFEYLFENNMSIDCLLETQAGWYDSNYKFHEARLAEKLRKECEAGKIIFVFMDFHNYIPFSEKRISLLSANNKYETHATGMIIYPNGTNRSSYSVYHFNPHGQSGAYCNEYVECISLKRRKSKPLDTGLDRYVMRALVESINRYFIADGARCNQLTYTIKKTHNYVGPNLQAGDNYGICYVFPAMFFIEICSNFKTPYLMNYQAYESDMLITVSRTFPCCSELLLSLNCTHIILLSISNYIPEIKQFIPEVGIIKGPRDGDAGTILEETYQFQKIEQSIEEKGTFFVKRILGTIIEYLTQKSIRDKVAEIQSQPEFILRT